MRKWREEAEMTWIDGNDVKVMTPRVVMTRKSSDDGKALLHKG